MAFIAPAKLIITPAQLITAPAQLITAPAQLITAPAQPPATGVVVYTVLFFKVLWCVWMERFYIYIIIMNSLFYLTILGLRDN